MQKPKRIMAVSCNHGHHANKAALDAVLKFRDEYDPHTVLHLGDAIDLQAFMASKVGKGDGEAFVSDIAEGIGFIQDLRPTIFFIGNHEDRLFRELRQSKNDFVLWAAGNLLTKIEVALKSIKADMVPYSGTFDPKSWRTYGGTAFGHGYMYGEMCARDHAEMLGQPVAFGHAHKLIRQAGRVVGAPEGICVGCLCDLPAMSYAKMRRQTAAWDHGFVWGEYTDKWCKLYIERINAWGRPQIPKGK
jgi:predicted phosphodiesterase